LRRILGYFGYTGGISVWVDPDDETREEVVAGNQRTGVIGEILTDRLRDDGTEFDDAELAALGMDPAEGIDVAVMRGYTKEDAVAYCIAHNNPEAQGQWDFAQLTGNLSTLDAEGYDATLTAFDEAQLGKMLGSVPPAAPAGFETLNEQTVAVEHQCPKCGFEFSGKK